MKRIILAEWLGTASLLMIVVGSGIMGERLAQGNDAIALLINAIATGCGLFVLISALGPISGAHFNPIVSLYAHFDSGSAKTELLARITAQFLGAPIGVILANVMFELPATMISAKIRSSSALWISEIIATLMLLSAIQLIKKQSLAHLAAAVSCTITSAYFFTSSTSFANPAVTLARTLSDSFAGIAPASVAGFVIAQLLALLLFCGAKKLLTR